MKYLTFIRHSESYRQSGPPAALMEAMGKFVESWRARMCTNAAVSLREPCIRSFFDLNLRVGSSANGNPLIPRAPGGRAVGSIG